MEAYFYHVYLNGNNYQDIFYTDHDFIQTINRLALAAHATDTKILAYLFHHNHFHLLVHTASVPDFMHYFRMSLTHWFRRRYKIRGTVGMRKYGKHRVKSEEDLRDVLKYILRNEIRHGIASGPFEAEWSSINYYFNAQKSRGQNNGKQDKLKSDERSGLLTDEGKIAHYLPRGKVLPAGYQMGANGLILPRAFLDTEAVESIFVSYEEFLEAMYSLSRQEILIRDKESRIPGAVTENRSGNEPSTKRMVKDAELLDFTIHYIHEHYAEKSLPTLSTKEKYAVATVIRKIYKKATYKQLSRLLALPLSTLHWNIRKF